MPVRSKPAAAAAMTTALHDDRLAAVMAVVVGTGALAIADLGCGDGDLLVRLAALPGVTRLIGLDPDRGRLKAASARLNAIDGKPVTTLVAASALAVDARLRPVDCALLVEVIEHLAPRDLGALEHAVMARLHPAHVVITTPNADYNQILGVPARRHRHPDHHFEWGRARFAEWTDGVASRHGYTVTRRDLAGAHPDLGGASQLAHFTLESALALRLSGP